MKPSTLLNLAVAGRVAIAGVPAERTYTARGTYLVARDSCNAGELLVYRTDDRFLCVGKTVFWTGVALTSITVPVASGAAAQFATWVVNKFTGSPSATESGSKRDVDEKQAEMWFDDEETVTYGWKPPTLESREGVSPYIHNMTVTYSKETGRMMQAEMTFDGEHDPIDGVAKRDSTPITITYYAVSGHEGTKLGYDDLYNLFHQIFVSSPGGVGSECGYAANSGTWHGAFKATVSGATDAGSCYAERQY